MATLTDSRIKSGTLRLEDDNGVAFFDFSCVPTAVAITPGTSENSGTDDLEVLCGSKFKGDGSSDDNSATLDITLVSDFLNPIKGVLVDGVAVTTPGLVAYSWQYAGEERKFEWIPANKRAGSVWKGTVKVQAIQVGGEVNTRLTPSVSWEIESLVLPPDYGGKQWIGPEITGIAIPAGTSKEWTWVPAGALRFKTLDILKGNGNVGDNAEDGPIRDFTVGEFALLSTGAKVHYKKATGWAADEAK